MLLARVYMRYYLVTGWLTRVQYVGTQIRTYYIVECTYREGFPSVNRRAETRREIRAEHIKFSGQVPQPSVRTCALWLALFVS